MTAYRAGYRASYDLTHTSGSAKSGKAPD